MQYLHFKFGFLTPTGSSVLSLKYFRRWLSCCWQSLWGDEITRRHILPVKPYQDLELSFSVLKYSLCMQI